jgi:hypothetical protein
MIRSFPPTGRVVISLLAFAALIATAFAQTPPVVRVTGVTPEPGSVLGGGQNFYARVVYESDQPLRFQAAGYLDGKMSDGLAMNPSPLYPAGKGETVVWVFGLKDARIDELHVRVCDARWKDLIVVPVSAQVEWRSGAPDAATAAWAAELSAAQQRAVGEAIQQEPESTNLLQKIWVVLATILVPVAFLSTPAYPIFQFYALWKLRGTMRWLAAIPLLVTLPAYAHSIYALSQGSNLWPIATIFASPVALIIVIVVMFGARKRAAENLG